MESGHPTKHDKDASVGLLEYATLLGAMGRHYLSAAFSHNRLVLTVLVALAVMFFVHRWPFHYNLLEATRSEARVIWHNTCWDPVNARAIHRLTIDCERTRGLMNMNVYASATLDILRECWQGVEQFITSRVRKTLYSTLGFIGMKALSDLFSFSTFVLIAVVLCFYFTARQQGMVISHLVDSAKAHTTKLPETVRQRKPRSSPSPSIEGRSHSGDPELGIEIE